jgi:predicted nuclease of predicted toxin-antitoxin system
VKLYLDEDLSPVIAQILRGRRVDAVSAHEAGMIGASDHEQLDHAAGEHRALVTRNAREFRILADRRVHAQQPHAGIVVCSPSVRGSEVAEIATALEALVRQRPEGLGPYDLLYLPASPSNAEVKPSRQAGRPLL